MASCKFQRSGGSSCEQCGAEPKIQAGFVSAAQRRLGWLLRDVTPPLICFPENSFREELCSERLGSGRRKRAGEAGSCQPAAPAAKAGIWGLTALPSLPKRSPQGRILTEMLLGRWCSTYLFVCSHSVRHRAVCTCGCDSKTSDK